MSNVNDVNAVSESAAQKPAIEEQREYVTSTCGSVTVVSRRPSPEQVQESIRASARIIERLWHRLQTPGITLAERDDVPSYTDDPENPKRFFRKLNGKIEAGYIVDGKFQLEATRV